MLTQINPILGFLEEVKELNMYPEITSDNFFNFIPENFNKQNRNPIHNGKYDFRLFKCFSNHLRKIIILDEPISLKNIHKNFNKHQELNGRYLLIQNYLTENINNVTSLSVNFSGSILDITTVNDLLNNYFAAFIQHSKAAPQEMIDEINSLTFGNVTEMVRIMMIRLKDLLIDYANCLEYIYQKNRFKI